MQYLVHLKDCFMRVTPDMQQNFAQLREVIGRMQALVPVGTPFVGDQVFNDLKTDSDYILAELTKLEQETKDLIHEVNFPGIVILPNFPQLDHIGTDLI